MNYIVAKLKEKISLMEQIPSGKPFPAEGWDFFKDDLEDWVICYVCNYSVNNLVFVNTFLLPESATPAECNEKLLGAEFSTVEGWILYNNGELDSPLSGRMSPFNECEPLYFSRYFLGYPKGEESYFEMNQKLTTTFGLHWVKSRDAFCSLNSCGDLVPEIILSVTENLSCVLIKRNMLDKYLSATNSNLIRCFEYRQIDDDIEYGKIEPKKEKLGSGDFCYENCYFNDGSVTKGLYVRGYNIVGKNKDFVQLEQEEREEMGGEPPLKFIIQDIRHENRVIKINLERENLSSYFERAPDKPWETSPVFFKPDVLNKYINDPEKYDRKERTITCRGGWHLQTYDINEQGQVHTMAIYLLDLPYEELCHWRSWNEAPKGSISPRSHQTDFLGKFYEQPEPINELLKALKQLEQINIEPEGQPLWIPHNGDFDQTFNGFHMVFGETKIEWQNFIQNLARILIEGLSLKVIRKISQRLDCYVNDFASIRLLARCLKKIGIPSDEILEITQPLLDLQDARSHRTYAHRARAEAPEPSERKTDAMERMSKIVNSIKKLNVICSEGKLNAPKK